METRGVSLIHTSQGGIPLDQYLAANPLDASANQDVLLLKVLDPSPQPVVGDLYFEVHEEKQEVYVVSHVHESAWPDGKGAIRFGMNQMKRAEFDNDDAFCAAYLAKVKAYEALRRQIDAGNKSADLQEQEVRARHDMEQFTSMSQLDVGDVVQVPTWTPHSLQHGVRVVEFQTPTYERFIVSFAQKVLTQDHWDTDHAVANMHLDTPATADLIPVQPGVEQIAKFSDFNVWRIDHNLAPTLTLPDHIPYAVCMSLTNACIADLQVSTEEACFVPHGAIRSGTSLSAEHGHTLLAAPGL